MKEILEIPEVKAVAQRARDRVSAENKQKDTRHNNSSSNGAEINHEASQNGAVGLIFDGQSLNAHSL